ncbi:hypothetical protein HKCCE3408_02110 [Rhodobacterales bacterium HKCCE3408]|nr:hypothetical protein [Rhodobacterales bacterium HKCCE3408]
MILRAAAIALAGLTALPAMADITTYSADRFLRDYGRTLPEDRLYIRDEDGTRLLLDILTGAIVETLAPLETGPRPMSPGEAGVRVPPGHLPGPGQCRVWFPGRPPGHQPPAGSCDVRVPDGAVLIGG